MISISIVTMIQNAIEEKKKLTKKELKKLFPDVQDIEDILGFLVSMHKIKIKKNVIESLE